MLKVQRELEKGKHEIFEFMSLDTESPGFNLFGLKVESVPLWNVEEIFKRKLKDLLLAESAVDSEPNLIAIRLSQPLPPVTRFMLSYRKQRFPSETEATLDSVLMKATPSQLFEDFELLKSLRRKQFDTKFTSVFKLTQERFAEDETLKMF